MQAGELQPVTSVGEVDAQRVNDLLNGLLGIVQQQEQEIEKLKAVAGRCRCVHCAH